MFKKFVLIAIIISSCVLLFSFEWGVKYGAGVSATYGKNSSCNIQYDFTDVQNDTVFVDYGSLNAKSNHRKMGLAHNAGLFVNFTLAEDVNKLMLQTEINWQRYNYSNKYVNIVPSSDNGMLVFYLGNNIKGSVKSTLDYVNIPVLLKMQQDKPSAETENESMVSSFGYVGPSVSFLVQNDVTAVEGVKDLDEAVQQFVDDSQTDPITNQYYTYTKAKNAVDEVKSLRYDIVMGFGWNLKNVLKLGFGSDDFVLDARFNLNLSDIGNADIANRYKQLSGIVSLGYKL